MNTDELKKNLEHLIRQNVLDQNQKKVLLELLFSGETIPVKGILADLMPYLNGKIEEADAEILKDIVFYYC